MGACTSSTSVTSVTRSHWSSIRKKLPRNKTPEDLKKRDELYKQFDPNGNGFLSFAEVEKGACQVLGLDSIISDKRQLRSILVRAFNCAKAARSSETGLRMVVGPTARGQSVMNAPIGSNAGLNEDENEKNNFVERVEFRLLLVYIYDYFEMYVAFEEIDASHDKNVTLEEFAAAVPKIKEWGVTIQDPEETFRTIDTSGGGIVSFQEFAEWAIQQHLRVVG